MHAADLDVVSLVSASLEAGSETHLHLRIHAAGECGIGSKVEVTAAHLEEVEGTVEEFLGRRSRSEWAVVDGFSVQPADLAGHVGARVLVVEIQADERRGTKLESLAVVARKDRAQRFVEQEAV